MGQEMTRESEWDRADQIEMFNESVAFTAGMISGQRMRSMNDFHALQKKQKEMIKEGKVILHVHHIDCGEIADRVYKSQFIIKYFEEYNFLR